MCSTRLPRETVSSWLWLLLCPVVASCTMRKWPCRHKLLHNWALCQQTMSNIVNPVARGTGHCRRGSGLQTTTNCCVPGKGGPPGGGGPVRGGVPQPRGPLYQCLQPAAPRSCGVPLTPTGARPPPCTNSACVPASHSLTRSTARPPMCLQLAAFHVSAVVSKGKRHFHM